MVLICISQMIRNVELFYSCTCWLFVCLIWGKKCLLMFFAYFFFFFVIELYDFLVYLAINPLRVVWFAHIFSHPVGCLCFFFFFSWLFAFLCRNFFVWNIPTCLFLLLFSLFLITNPKHQYQDQCQRAYSHVYF